MWWYGRVCKELCNSTAELAVLQMIDECNNIVNFHLTKLNDTEFCFSFEFGELFPSSLTTCLWIYLDYAVNEWFTNFICRIQIISEHWHVMYRWIYNFIIFKPLLHYSLLSHKMLFKMRRKKLIFDNNIFSFSNMVHPIFFPWLYHEMYITRYYTAVYFPWSSKLGM